MRILTTRKSVPRKFGRWMRNSIPELLTLTVSIPLLCIAFWLAIDHLIGYYQRDSFTLFSETLGVVSVATVFIAIYTAIRAERINRSLVETQTVSSRAVTGFRQLFERHLLKHFYDGVEGVEKIERVDLILSTPAFGLHPLNGDQCNKFIEVLKQTRGLRYL